MEEDEAACMKTGIQADALERARQFRQELAAAARSERMNQIDGVLKI